MSILTKEEWDAAKHLVAENTFGIVKLRALVKQGDKEVLVERDFVPVLLHWGHQRWVHKFTAWYADPATMGADVRKNTLRVYRLETESWGRKLPAARVDTTRHWQNVSREHVVALMKPIPDLDLDQIQQTVLESSEIHNYDIQLKKLEEEQGRLEDEMRKTNSIRESSIGALILSQLVNSGYVLHTSTPQSHRATVASSTQERNTP